MPTYSVRLRVNVPTLGERNVDQTGIVAADIAEAITSVIVEPIAAQKTA